MLMLEIMIVMMILMMLMLTLTLIFSGSIVNHCSYIYSFETMSKNLRLDLDAVQSARKHKDPPPRFHYEDRSFTIVE